MRGFSAWPVMVKMDSLKIMLVFAILALRLGKLLLKLSL
jgi:hypothetical protein